MKFVNQNVEKKEQQPWIDGVYKQIEWAARHCYNSFDKQTEDSYREFYKRMIKSGHHSVLEHGTIYLFSKDEHVFKKYENNHYSVVNFIYGQDGCYITTNFRVIHENNWYSDLEFLTVPLNGHIKRTSLKIITSRAIAQQATRHRDFSFSMQSQRYCGYNKDKYNKEITYIIPKWLNIPECNNVDYDLSGYWIGKINDKTEQILSYHDNFKESLFLDQCLSSESSYMLLLEKGLKPEEARSILNNSVATELIMTGTEFQWNDFIKKRHPENVSGVDAEMEVLAKLIKNKLNEV